MNDGNAGAAAPFGTTSAPAAAGATGTTGTGAGGTQQPSGAQQPAAGGQQPPAGGHQTPPQQTPPADGAKPPDGQQPPAPDFKIPDAYKDKPWASKVKSMDDVFKQLDNLDTLAGKKAIIPDLKNATPEQKEAFYQQLRPKDASAYVIPDEISGFPIAPAVKEGVGKMFLENGISEVQGNAVINAYNEIGKAQVAEQFNPEGMKTQLTEAFGKDWEAITRQTRNTIKGMMTPADQEMLDKMPNNYLAPIYRTLGNVIKKYGIRETDNAHFTGATGSAVAGDMVQQRALIRGEIAKLGDQPHTIDQANALRQKLADTYKNDPRIQGR